MITVDLTTYLVDFDGNPLPDEENQPVKMSTIVSRQYLQRQQSNDPVGDYEIARELHKKGTVSVTSTQLKDMKTLVKDSKTLTVVAKGQVLKVLEALKENDDDDKSD
jgi:glutamine synthetase adenylyltransferase